MQVLTIAREYGAGGGALARQLASSTGWQLWDRELLHEAARVENVPDAAIERLDEQAVTLADRLRLHPPHHQYLRGLTEAVQQAARRGQVILLGRGAAHLLAGVDGCLHVRLVAPAPWRAARMAQREGCTPDAALARCTAMDRARRQFHRYFFGDAADQPAQFDLVANTARMPLDVLAATIGDLVTSAAPPAGPARAGQPVLTLARELGAGDRGFAPPLAEQLGLDVVDRDLLEEEARRLGIALANLEKIDERPARLFQRFHPGSVHHRYVQTLGQLMCEHAERGRVLLMGRGGFRFLQHVAQAFHVRLVAAMPTRVRRVMEYHWVREGVARKLIARSDAQRSSFCRDCFGADWTSPLEYHITVNSGRLGATAVDLVAAAATRFWAQLPSAPSRL